MHRLVGVPRQVEWQELGCMGSVNVFLAHSNIGTLEARSPSFFSELPEAQVSSDSSFEVLHFVFPVEAQGTKSLGHVGTWVYILKSPCLPKVV